MTALLRWIPIDVRMAWFCKPALSATDDVPKKRIGLWGAKNKHGLAGYSDRVIFEKQAIFARHTPFFPLQAPRDISSPEDLPKLPALVLPHTTTETTPQPHKDRETLPQPHQPRPRNTNSPESGFPTRFSLAWQITPAVCCCPRPGGVVCLPDTGVANV